MTPRHCYEFGGFTLDPVRRVLLKEGEPVPLQPKAFDTLLVLIDRRDAVVTKDELLRTLWPDTFVDEANLSQNIYVLRRALGHEGDGYLKTVPKHGYRFVGEVREVDAGAEAVDPADQIARNASLPPAASPRGRRALALAAVGLVLCLFAGLGYLRWPRASVSSSPHIIAVLPFRSLGAHVGDEYLGVGLCDVLITKLSGLHRDLVVRPTSTVLKYENAGADTVAAGRELHADAILEGSLQRDGERLRVTVRLINVADGAPLWAQTFDERFGDLFKVQDAIAQDVTRALAVTLGQDGRAHISRPDTQNIEAYQLYLKGRYFWQKGTEVHARKSIACFEQAIALDPDYALAYSGLADAYRTLHFLGRSTEVADLSSRARAAALKALALDGTLAEAHTSLGAIKEVYDLDFAGAESEYSRALELNPNYATGRQRYGFLLNKMGRIDEAAEEFRRALAIDPLSPIINTDAARPFIRSRNYPRAIEQLKTAVDIDPHFPRAHNLLALCYTELGRYDEAISEARQAAALSAPSGQGEGPASELSYQIAYIYARAGRTGDARRVLQEMERAAPAPSDQLVWHALAYVALGERDRAFTLIEQLYDTRNTDLAWLKFGPQWDDLRSDSRFQAILRRSGLTR